MMPERGGRLLVLERQGHPALDAMHARAASPFLWPGPFAVNDAAPGDHPVEIAGADGLQRTRGCRGG